MKAIGAALAAAGFMAALAMPAHADQTQTSNGVTSTAKVEHTEISAQRRYYRHRNHYRYRPYVAGPRYGYYRPYRYGPYAYQPGVSFGFWGGPRLGVWF